MGAVGAVLSVAIVRDAVAPFPAVSMACTERVWRPSLAPPVATIKVDGPFVWHKHDETDDFFLVVEGKLTIHLRDRDVELSVGVERA